MASKIKSRHVYKHQCKIPVTIRSLLLCLLHGFPCRIYLLAHYAFVASKIRMVPQGNEINISNSAFLLPISRPTSWQTLLILQDPTIINVNYWYKSSVIDFNFPHNIKCMLWFFFVIWSFIKICNKKTYIWFYAMHVYEPVDTFLFIICEYFF